MAPQIFKVKEIPHKYLCKICFLLPPKEIFQCGEGHVICKKCFEQLTECPSCSTPFNPASPIRCEDLEAQLEYIKIKCSFKSKGCNEALHRANLSDHTEKCQFNFKKFGNLISVCKQMGYLNCDYKFNFGGVLAGVDHLISEHDWVLTEGLKLDLELVFPIQSNSVEIYTPVIVDVKEKQGFIGIMPIINKEEFYFILLWLPYSTNEIFEVPVRVKLQIGENIHLSLKPRTLNGLWNALSHCNFQPMQLPRDKNSLKIQICIQDDKGNDLGVEAEQIICSKSCNFSTLIYQEVELNYDKVLSLPAFEKFKILIEGLQFNKMELIHQLFEESLSAAEEECFEEFKTHLICIVAMQGSVEILKYLIEKGVNTNLLICENPDDSDDENEKELEEERFGISLIMYALEDEQKLRGAKKVNLLLEHNNALALFQCKVPGMVMNLLHISVYDQFPNADVAKILVENGLAVNSELETPDVPIKMTPLDMARSFQKNDNNFEFYKIEFYLLKYGTSKGHITDLDWNPPDGFFEMP